MKTKLLTFVLCFAVLALSLTLANALTINTNPSSIELNQDALSKTLNVSFNDFANGTISVTGGISVTPTTFNNVSSVILTITASSISVGTHTATITINATNSTNSTDVATPKVYTISLVNTTNPLCSGSNPGKLDISDTEFNVLDGFGDDGYLYFYPLDKVEYEFTVDNNGDYDISDVEITACLWDEKQAKCIMKESKMDLSSKKFDLDSDDSKDVKITFTIDPNKLKVGNTKYILYVSANGDVDDRDSSYDGNSSCTSESEKLEIRTDDNFVILNNFIAPEQITCNSDFDITADLWNIGDEDLKDDEVYILVYNKELGINEEISLSEDLDSLDKKEMVFTLKTKANIDTTKTYKLEFSIYDDDSYADEDIYQNSEDDEAKFDVPIKITSCGPTVAKAIITADLSSQTQRAVIGQQVIVEATVKNTGTSSETYTVEVTGNTQWSSVTTIDPKTLTLNAGDSKKVLIYLDIDKEATTGDKEFTIKATSSSNAVTEQKIIVSLEKGISGSAIINHLKNNWYIYVIALVNLILIIAIIAVIVRLVRKSSD